MLTDRCHSPVFQLMRRMNQRVGESTMLCLLKQCNECGGDLVSEDSDWKCIQCGQYYYSEPASVADLVGAGARADEPERDFDTTNDRFERTRRGPRKTRSTRNINSLVQAKIIGEARWWARNSQIIQYLDNGLSVRERGHVPSSGVRVRHPVDVV